MKNQHIKNRSLKKLTFLYVNNILCKTGKKILIHHWLKNHVQDGRQGRKNETNYFVSQFEGFHLNIVCIYVV